jgi:predicted Rossmann fold flavoprotein
MKIGIIGGGAAGMIAAITAARTAKQQNIEADITLFDTNKLLGKKILSTGNGRCNLTNAELDVSKYHSNNLQFVAEALDEFGLKETIDFFMEIGVLTKSKEGYVYPRSNQASTVRELLENTVQSLGIKVCLNATVTDIFCSNNIDKNSKKAHQIQDEKDTAKQIVPNKPKTATTISFNKLNRDSYELKEDNTKSNFFFGVVYDYIDYLSTKTNNKGNKLAKEKNLEKGKKSEKEVVVHKDNTIGFDKIILTAGGQASNISGSNGIGYKMARKLGHDIIPIVPALVGLKVKNNPLKLATGVRIEAIVTAVIEGDEIAKDCGELQVTDYGISGIPTFQISSFIARALLNKQRAVVKIDFAPDMTEELLAHLLVRYKLKNPNQAIRMVLHGIFPDKLVSAILAKENIDDWKQLREIKPSELEKIVHSLKNIELMIDDTNDFKNAQVCAGGINVTEVNANTMQSKLVQGLYFAGEVLDVDGICGGYNLQWAWSSGYVAGKNIFCSL